jgi:hypothetical protein
MAKPKTTMLKYKEDKYAEVPEEIVTILNDVFMEGGQAYRSGGWHKVYRGYIGSHSDWEHTIATAYLKLKKLNSSSSEGK